MSARRSTSSTAPTFSMAARSCARARRRRSSSTRTFAASTWANVSRSRDRAMAISQRMDLRQSQSLVMTPQLQQAIKLLELSNLELSAYVEEQLESNPLLERESESPDDGEASTEPAAPPAGDGALPDTAAVAHGQADSPDASAGDAAYDNLWQGEEAGASLAGDRGGTGGGRGLSVGERSPQEALTPPAGPPPQPVNHAPHDGPHPDPPGIVM